MDEVEDVAVDGPFTASGELLETWAAAAGITNIAASAVHGVEYLLTWNFRHLANAETRPLVREVCERQGYASPEICTPSELMGGTNDA